MVDLEKNGRKSRRSIKMISAEPSKTSEPVELAFDPGWGGPKAMALDDAAREVAILVQSLGSQEAPGRGAIDLLGKS